MRQIKSKKKLDQQKIIIQAKYYRTIKIIREINENKTNKKLQHK